MFWKMDRSGIEEHKKRLVSVYYGKALSFTELGYCKQALEVLKQVNQLKVLEEGWAIYPKLLEVTEMLQNKEVTRHKFKESNEGLMSIIRSSIGGLFGLTTDSPLQEIVKEENNNDSKDIS